MKNFFAKIQLILVLPLLLGGLLLGPLTARAAGGYMAPSGGGKFVVGQTFTIRVTAAGATFNAFQGQINVSGPISIVSFSQGSFNLINGKVGNGNSFAAYVTSPVSSITVATIQLKGTKEGSGSVSVSGVRLANSGSEVGTSGGSTSFTIGRAPTPPGAVTVTSSTNPDPSQSYGVTTVQLAWTAPANGATGYAIAFDQTADTNPGQTANTTATTATYDNLNLGTYYFHIRAQNGDGWGPVTHFAVNISRATDTGLKAPTITTVTKLGTFKNDVVAGTVTNFTIGGSSTNLAGFTVTLGFTPAASIPATQKLDAPINADGSWSVTFDQPIPSGFYKVTAVANKDKTATPVSTPVNIELSVANGGTAKIITTADLPQPDLTVKVAGITFADKKHFHWTLALVLGSMVVLVLLAILLPWLIRRYWPRHHDNTKPRQL